MPEVVASRSCARPQPEIWAFVQDMDKWAPMLPGYAGHEVLSETDSTWLLEGDLGPFTKTVKLAVHITERTAMHRIAFEVVGVGEDARGGGTFVLREQRVDTPPPPPRTWWQRLVDWLFGRQPALPPPPGATEVTFTFRIEAGGPMGPMINALLGPFAEQVARELVDRVGAHLENTR